MNAPETHITEPINAAHTVLIQATEALCIDQVAKAAGVGKSAATKQLKALSDLGLLEAEFRTGGTPYYFLTVPQPAQMQATSTEIQVTSSEVQPTSKEMQVSTGVCSKCLGSGFLPKAMSLPEPPDVKCPNGCKSPIDWTSPEMTYLAPEDYELPPADPVMLALANRELGEQVAKLEEQLSAAAADVVRTRQALTNAINEADRLRAELAAERQAREALQQQSNAAPINARGYVVSANNREPTFHLKLSAAKKVAEAVAKKSGQAYMDALVPMGSARMAQCVEWRNAA